MASAVLVPALAIVLAGCESAVTSSTGPSPVKCQVAMAPPGEFGPAGGAGSVTVTAAPECAWNASTDTPWISGLTPASGQGGADIRFQVGPNQSSRARQGAIRLGDVVARIGQSGASCTFDVDPGSATVASSGGTGTVRIATLSDCDWSATNDVPWLSITSGTSGTGSGTVTFSAAANTGAARVGTFEIAGQRFTVTQEAPGAPDPLCAYNIQPAAHAAPIGGGGAEVAVTAPAACSWTAASNESWLRVVGASMGTGSGPVAIDVAANPGNARTGTLTIAGHTFIVRQAGSCAASLAPTSASLGVAGGPGPVVTVTTATGCAWTAASSVPWLTFTSAPNGTGSGTVEFTAAANSGGARTGTLTIAGHTFIVRQAGSCAASLAPTSASLGAAGGPGPVVTVTTATGCAWTAASSVPWLTFTSAPNGTGSGTVEFTAAANSGGARTGTLTIAGQTFTVTQAGSCAASLAPTSASLGAAGGPGPVVAVTTATGCAWTAATSTSWLTLTSAPNGTGSGTVEFTAAANSGDARSGTLTIAGETFTVSQAAAAVACTYALSRDRDSFGRNGGTSRPVEVTTTPGCSWTVVPNDPWITVITEPSGVGPGTVRFSVARNRDDDDRQGSLTIAGLTFGVTQEGDD